MKIAFPRARGAVAWGMSRRLEIRARPVRSRGYRPCSFGLCERPLSYMTGRCLMLYCVSGGAVASCVVPAPALLLRGTGWGDWRGAV